MLSKTAAFFPSSLLCWSVTSRRWLHLASFTSVLDFYCLMCRSAHRNHCVMLQCSSQLARRQSMVKITRPYNCCPAEQSKNSGGCSQFIHFTYSYCQSQVAYCDKITPVPDFHIVEKGSKNFEEER